MPMSNCELVHLETDNFNPFFEVTRQDNRGDRTCLWIVEQIKKLLGYSPECDNNIHYVPNSSNRSAHYLAIVGLNNWTSMHYILEPFGRLQEKLDPDMGFGPPIPQLLVSPIPLDEQGFVLGFAPVQDNVVESAVQDQVSVNGGDNN